MDGDQQTPPRLPLLTALFDQHRQQVDRTLQEHVGFRSISLSSSQVFLLAFSNSFLYMSISSHFLQQNEQVRLQLQQQISAQNETLLNLAESMARDALAEKNGEVSRLRMELKSTQELLRTALQERDEVQYLAKGFYEMNRWLIMSRLPPVLQATTSVVHALDDGSSSTGSCSQAPNVEGASVGRSTTRVVVTRLLCKVCCARDACMLILPCQHLCACESCGSSLTVCPLCYLAKDNVMEVEARFG
jgi:E3 ubiquitin-protein ligase BOI and related proteins